ncbi:MAG: hypothetical protein KKH01_02895 [Firmicutes bacterium]|nr:hypothetical protein [Bacillota bacterium]
MNVYRKSLVVQLMLFGVFFLIGANVILTHYLSETMPWLTYVIISLLVVGGVLGFIIYKRPDTRISVVTPKEMSMLRYLLYGYFFFYILQMILSSVQVIKDSYLDLLNIATGSILMLIALYGGFTLYKILKIK